MAERPSPHSVAVCTLIALYSDPCSLIHVQKPPNAHPNTNDYRSERYLGKTMGIHDDGGEDGMDIDPADGNNTRWKPAPAPSLQEHLSKVIKDVVITNADGWMVESNGRGGGYGVDAKTMPLSSLLDMISAVTTVNSGYTAGVGNGGGRGSNRSNRNGPFHYAAKFLLDDLAQSCTSIDSLVDLFSALRSTVAKGIVDGDSAHGIYVRKRCLGFDELSFESVGRFWESFCVYVADASKWGTSDASNNPSAGFGYGFGCTGSPNASPRLGGNRRGNARVRKRASPTKTLEGSTTNSNHSNQSNHSNPTEQFYASLESFPSDEITSHDLPPSPHKSQPIPHPPPPPDPTTNKWPLAPRQISRKLLQQCLVLHKQVGRISYTRMEAQIQEILQENPELTLAHFLRFLNCALHGERVGALEHFHRYFDYAMIQERKDRSLWGTNVLSPNGHNSSSNANAAQQSNSSSGSLHKNVVQYAAILLASLFHTFANDELAHLATEEAVRVAQQSGDGSCLAFALGWLHATTDGGTDASPGGGNPAAPSPSSGIGRYGGAEMLTRAGSRAAANDLRTLVSGAALTRANFFAAAAGPASSSTLSREGGAVAGSRGMPPVRIWESVAAASTDGGGGGGGAGGGLNGGAVGGGGASHDAPTLITNLDDAGDAMEIFAQQHLVSAGLWHSMGHNSMASTTAHLTVRCYGDYLSSEQHSYLARNVARSVLYGMARERSSSEPEVSDKSRSLSWSLQRLGLNSFNSYEGSNASPSAKPRSVKPVPPTPTPVLYRTALETLQEFQSKTDNTVGANSKHNVTLLMNEWSIRRFDIHAATSFNTLLYSFSPLASKDGILAAIEAMGQHCLLLCRKRNWEAAKQLILKRICPLCERNRFRTHRAHYLLQAALIELDSKTDDPVCALHLILECLALCAGQSMDSMHATALSLLARLHLKLDNGGRARAVLRAAMPTILQHGHVCFHGEAWLTMAKCSLGEAKDLDSRYGGWGDTSGSGEDAGRRRGGRRRKVNVLKGALEELNKAEIAFERVQDVVRLREVFYLQARTYDSMKDGRSKRNEAARKFQGINCRMVKSVLPVWHDAIASVREGIMV